MELHSDASTGGLKRASAMPRIRSLDRLYSNELIMTHELIANMPGVRREGVTDAAGKLQKLGVVRYRRGRITVLNRPQLAR